jgi:hypothetical protein
VTLYRDRRLSLVTSIKDFEREEHDGLIHNDHLYLRRDKIMKKIRAIEPSAEFDEMLDNLKVQLAFYPESDKTNSRKMGGTQLRFYAVKLHML